MARADCQAPVAGGLSWLASPWHIDLDLGRPLKVMTDISKSRKLGFQDYQLIKDLFAQLHAERLFP